MLHKIHLKLTLLFAGIAAAIMVTMSFGYLSISQHNLLENHYLSFQSDIETLLANLEQQTVFSHDWLSKMEYSSNYTIYLIDNGHPYLYNERNGKFYDDTLFYKLYEYCRSNEMLDDSPPPLKSMHSEFSYDSRLQKEASLASRQADYLVSAASISRPVGILQALIVSSNKELREQISRQRFLFLMIDLAAVAALSLFSYGFTRRLLKPIEENQRRQNEFIAAASHELRTPLSVILANADACRCAPPDKLELFLSGILSEGNRMQGLVDSMLSLARGICSHVLIQQSVEMDTLLLNLYELYEPIAEKEKLSLSISLPDDTVLCSCDDGQIRQLLSILLQNAVSYTPAGGNIDLSLSADHCHCYISVADTGCGISSSDKKHIFERFYRADASHSAKDHFGLGLSIAKEIADSHKGSITFSDNPGGGSIFRLKLPI